MNREQLQNKNLELTNEEIQLRIQSKKCDSLSSKIEHARRNIDVLFKFYTSSFATSDDADVLP